MSLKINPVVNSQLLTLLFAGSTVIIASSPVRLGAANAVGLSQGKLTAEPSGGASYQLPIVVSPGSAGIQPKLAFQYSSGGRNGALGVGWSVSGVSAISRAPQTRAQDGAIHGVDMTLADRYSLDGQRLIALVGGNGYAGTEYRTEINSFTKVISNGASGNGPATFTARTKSGLIYTFGGANGASYIPPGRTDGTILTWLVSKVQDQAGNYMTFSYTSEANLSSVTYTMNDGAGLGSFASVVFTYAASRPDPATGYVAGSAIRMNQRLSRVTSYYGSQIVRQYDLAYEVSANTGKSRLISITEGTGTQTYPPTVFTWDNDPNSIMVTSSLAADTQSLNNWVQGDFDGDGLCDTARASGNKIQIYKVGTNGLVATGSFTSSQTFDSTTDTWLQGDFGGDGKLDLVRVHGQSGSPVVFTLFTNTGTNGSATAFTQSNATISGVTHNFYASHIYMAMDVNGDGKLDIVCINGVDPLTGNPQPLKMKVFLNNPDGNAPGTLVGQTWNYSSAPNDPAAGSPDDCKQNDQWFAGDFNGDGLADLAKLMPDNSKQSVRVYLNQNASYLAAHWINQSGKFFRSDGITRAYTWALGDFNGDGLIDFVRIPKPNNPDNATTADVFLSTGSVSTRFTAAQAWLTLTAPERGVVQAGDYNGDGRSDLTVISDYFESNSTLDPALDSPTVDDSALADPADGSGYNIDSVDSSAEIVASTGYTVTTTRDVYLSNGGGFYLASTGPDMVMQSSSPKPRAKNLTADFTGDGKEDLIRIFATYLNIYLSNPGYQDLMRSITDGMGAKTSVDYQPLTGINGIPVFTKSTDAVRPAIDLIEPMPVVASITYDNGLGAVGSAGSTYSVSYRYEGLKADPLRGMLGFRAIEAIDNRVVDGQASTIRVHAKSWLKQGFPYTGMLERASSYLAAASATKSFTDHSGLLSDAITLYAAGPTENAKVYFPYAQDSHVYSWDLTGAQTNDTETIAQQMDAYGNTLTSVVKTKNLPSTNFFIKTTTSSYDISTSNWRIGQVTGSSVLSQAPGQPNITRTSGFSYNASNGQVGSETVEPDGASWMSTDYAYDAFGNTKKSTTTGNDMVARITQTIYDVRGRFLATTINALGHTELKGYDERFGAVTSVTGPNNLIDTARYDGFSRQTLATRADGVKTVTSYEWVSGNANAPNAPANSVYLVRVTPDDGPQTITYFDRLGREMRKRTLDVKNRAILIDTTYDYRGRKKTVTKPYFAGSSATVATSYYDALDRVIQLKVPSVDENGSSVTAVTTTSYDGLVTTMTNPKGQTSTTTKDAAGHVIQVEDALNGTITYTYDALGQLTRTVDAASNTTTIGYNVRGRKISVNDPDLGRWTYDYYATGELKWQKDANGQQVNFQYDQLGRMTRRDEPTTDYTVWTYDTATGKGIGKLASVAFTPASGSPLSPYSNTISYDNLGRPSSQSTLISGTTYVSRTDYDGFSRPTTLTYPTGFHVKQVYGTNGYLTDIKSPDDTKTYWTQRENDAEGHITEEQYGNGIITDRVYIPQNGLLKQIRSYVGISTNPTVQSLDYRFDVLGNLKKRTDNNQTIGGSVLSETFNYDDLNRLINSTVTGQAQKNYSYDTIGATTASLGNITHKDGVGDYTYDPVHKHAVRTAGASAVATYDANGNMRSGFNRTLTWTWFNMPERIQGYSASAYFTYDPDHNRIAQQYSSGASLVVTTYVGGFFERVDKDSEIEDRHYISAPTGRIAIYASHQNKQTYAITYDTKYLHRDHLGSVDVISSESGAVFERDSFDAWGFRRTTDWQSQQPIGSTSIVSRGFTDHEQLDTLGLVHMNGRVYDPGIGRFLSADPFVQAPMVTQNFNRYSYVVNNPLSLTDPSGFNIFGDFFNWLSGVFGKTGAQIVIGVASIAVGIVTAGAFTAAAGAILSAYEYALTSLGTAIVGGAGFGFGAGFTGTLLSGGSIGQAFQAGLIGGIIGGISGGIAHELGLLNPYGDFLSPGHLAQTAGHAVLGGTVSEIQGDNFGSGALAAGLSALFAPGINMIGGGSLDLEYKAARVAASAAIGGTAAELGGGKFANGAVTAAFLRLYNDEGAVRARAEYERRIEAIRARIAQFALEAEDSSGWLKAYVSGDFPAGRDKCNKFVYDIIKLAGADVELIKRAWYGSPSIPLAKEWANVNLDMPNWRIVGNPQPGDIAAIGRPNGTGHVGIVVLGNQTISASSLATPAGLIVLSPWGFRGDEGASVVFRRYVGPGY